MEIKSRQTLILIVAIFIFALGFGIVIPVIPFYAKNAGASALVLGLLLAVFSFLQFFCGPFWGKISDNIGRKPVVLIGLLGFTIAFVMLGLSNNLAWVFAAEIIGGALSAGIQPAAMAFIADITTPEERGGLMGAMGAASGVGLISGPFLSSVLSPLGLSVPFYVAAAMSFVTLLGVNILITETRKSFEKLTVGDLLLPVFVVRMIGESLVQMVVALVTPVGIYLLATLVISFAISGFEGTFAYYIMDTFRLTENASSVNIFYLPITITGPLVTGIVFALMGVVMVVCQGLMVGRLINRFGEELVIIGGLLVSATGLLLMVLPGKLSFVPPDLGFVVGFICIVSVGSGLVFPSLNTIISRKTDEKDQGIVMGIMTSFGNFGRILGPPIAGFTYDVYLAIPYLLSAAIMIATAAGVFVLAMGHQKKDQVTVALEQIIR
ncbi:MAG TPA: MFS transporter [Methanocella sp.]|nr:MFS transporter [Methanocella sp.]